MNVALYERKYIEIAKVIWSIMSIEAKEYVVQCEIFPNTESCKLFWITSKSIKKEYSMNDFPDEIATKLIFLFRDLNNLMKLDGNFWSHCQFTLTESGEFNIQFAYIPKEDSWNMLYMKGISDLTEEETKEYYIPLEIWRDRVNRKEEIYAKFPIKSMEEIK
ncbi:immunity protein YezG family protein [Histophilus somni]|nr:hypothetical protein [Histophilus somni]ACA31419.1 hypothetical protein HSM_1650 [Histophilus somni 2336]MBB5152461.1 hypothetical protein [Histophilus somni]